MTTLEDIKHALSQSKTGADFPRYVQRIIKLGVAWYETHVGNLASTYHLVDGSIIESPGIPAMVDITPIADAGSLKKYIRIHQQGGSDLATVRGQAASCGVDTWIVDTKNMTCTYHDVSGAVILEEQIPMVIA